MELAVQPFVTLKRVTHGNILRNMTKYNHLEPASQGPTFIESLAVVMLFSLLMFLMLGCALGEFLFCRHGTYLVAH